MKSSTNQRYLESVRRLLAAQAGGKLRTQEQGIAVATRLYETLAEQLSPIVGDEGFDALFTRSLKKTKPDFPALADLETTGRADAVLAQFCERLRKQEAAVMEELIVTVMVTFIGLLSTFIGEGLAWKLLRNAWPETLPNEPPSGEIR